MADAGLEFREEIRAMCEQNLCGMCGRNWACPPYVPPPQTCQAIVTSYSDMMIFRTTHPREGAFDLEGMQEAARKHDRISREVREQVRGICDRFLMLAAGGCSFCKDCACPDKCRFPKEKLNSIESYCIDLDSFLLKHGIERRGGNAEQSYFTMVFWRGSTADGQSLSRDVMERLRPRLHRLLAATLCQ